MRLVVCSTFAQAQDVKNQYPRDLVVVEGQSIRGRIIEEIIDLTIPQYGRNEEWWETIRTMLR